MTCCEWFEIVFDLVCCVSLHDLFDLICPNILSSVWGVLNYNADVPGYRCSSWELRLRLLVPSTCMMEITVLSH